MKKNPVIHPFLFGLFPVLFLYSHNIGQLKFSETLLPSAIILAFTAVILLLLWLVLKRNIGKAGIITSVILILFFSYGHIYKLIKEFKIGSFIIGRHRYLMIVFALVFIIAAYFLVRTRKELYNLTKSLNAVAIILILIPLVSIGISKIKTMGLEGDKGSTVVQEDIQDTDIQGDLPDIYYIILDGYASSNTLKEFYDYDNSDLDNFLKDNNFYVASESTSNYPNSFLSIASSLNMKYINYLSDTLGKESNDRSVPYEMIKDSKVMDYLKSKGYKVIHFSSGWGPTNYNQNADLNVAISHTRWNEFNTLLIQTTALDAFEKKFFQDVGRSRVLNTFKSLADVSEIEGKKFTFSHIVCPHPPYLFDRNGNAVPGAEFDMDNWGSEQKEYYLNQLIYINKEVKNLVSEILSRSEDPPVIILQADHGPRNTFIEGQYPTDDMFKEGMRILNAIYIPDCSYGLLYDSITPVNTFRVIFNSCFGEDYQLLEDLNYNSFEFAPYQFTDVTDIVDYK
ncbi:MAG: hypothetical protein U9O59_02635 [Actinomycetota bacterium]|nr:hypothetical protein [Actinomycetota bacterium]